MKIIKNTTLLLLLLIVSCASRKDILYLQETDSIDVGQNNTGSPLYNLPKFKPDDRLTINVSSINSEAARPFNLYLASFSNGGLSSGVQPQQQSYLIDNKGNIEFPQLGKISVIGKNRIELQDYLTNELKIFLPDAKVNVELVNFSISILGELISPGQYIVNRDKISILQAISLAGDLTIHAKRNNIKVVREVNQKYKYYNLDLTSKDIVNSPAFYLQQNDVVYVSPNKARINASASSPTASYIISATGLLITIISILTR
ncbi:polysaccharide biosynthesis/export family protein [Flavobacteriaceae bacterium]|nr:polysaccharide biosynthesis/export family protein [Flavobacteriaceae bacterium]